MTGCGLVWVCVALHPAEQLDPSFPTQMGAAAETAGLGGGLCEPVCLQQGDGMFKCPCV